MTGSGESAAPLGAWMLLGVALLAVSSAGAVLQAMDEIPPVLRASWRMQGTALVLLPGFFYQFRKMDRSTLTSRDWQIMLASSVFLAIHFGSWVWSLDHTSLIHSLLFVSSHPLVLVLFMPLIGVAVRKGHIVGVLVGFAGALLSLGDVKPGGEVTLMGDVAAFLGALTVVGYLFAGRYLRSQRQVPIFVYAFPVTFVAGILLAAASVLQEGSGLGDVVPESSLFGWSDALWLPWIAFLSIGPGLCGHTEINAVLRWIAPVTVSIVLLFEPVIGGLIGWLWTGETTLGMWTVLGGPLMLAGAVLVTLEESVEEPFQDTVS